MGRGADDSGGIVVGWLARVTLVLALIGAVGFDAFAVTVAHVTVRDDAGLAARTASQQWHDSQDVQAAYDAAVDSAKHRNPLDRVETPTFRVDDDETVHLVVTRTAPTLLVARIGPIASWAHVRAAGTGRYRS